MSVLCTSITISSCLMMLRRQLTSFNHQFLILLCHPFTPSLRIRIWRERAAFCDKLLESWLFSCLMKTCWQLGVVLWACWQFFTRSLWAFLDGILSRLLNWTSLCIWYGNPVAFNFLSILRVSVSLSFFPCMSELNHYENWEKISYGRENPIFFFCFTLNCSCG